MKTLRFFLLLLFVVLTCSTYSPASILKSGRKMPLERTKIWDSCSQKTLPICPINACIIDNICIDVQFFSDEGSPATLQINDNFGNPIYQDIIVVTSEETYQIDISKFKKGKYTLIYSDKNVEMTGEFEKE